MGITSRGVEEYHAIERYCAYCGSYMYISYPKEYVFVRDANAGSERKKWFCGWNCMRAYDKEKAEKKTVIKQEKKIRAFKLQEIEGAVPPDTYVKSKYTIHRCGKCGKRIAMKDRVCKGCNTPINWIQYIRKEIK